jgi:succinate dehydrogenase / fumarate reductase cytochrome b subunit
MRVAGWVRSTVGTKWLLAGSGAVLLGWLALHMLANLSAFSGASAIDGYAASLRRIAPLLWAVRITVLAAACVHVVAAVSVVRRARRARGTVRLRQRARAATVASRTMAWGGALLLAFLVFHLLHMTFGLVHPAFVAGGVHHNLVTGLASVASALLYVAAAGLVGLHLFHGLYALPRTLGLLDAAARERKRPVALIVALALALGFAVVPAAVLAGVLR